VADRLNSLRENLEIEETNVIINRIRTGYYSEEAHSLAIEVLAERNTSLTDLPKSPPIAVRERVFTRRQLFPWMIALGIIGLGMRNDQLRAQLKNFIKGETHESKSNSKD